MYIYYILTPGADPDRENALCVTPIWNAVHSSELALVESLIQCNVRLCVASRGIDQEAETDQPTPIYATPRTPLYVACTLADRRIAERLLLAGADITAGGWFWSGDFPAQLRDDAHLLHWITHQVGELTNPTQFCG